MSFVIHKKGSKSKDYHFGWTFLSVGEEARRASQSQTSSAQLENQMEFSPCRRRFPLCWRCTASSCGSTRWATSFFFPAVCLAPHRSVGILCSGSSRQTALQSSVPPAAIQFTSTLSFLYMTAGKQILPACRCALRIIKFNSIQHLICQAKFFPPFLWNGYEPINIHVYTLEQLHRDRFTRQNCFSVSLFVNNCNPSL